MADSATTKHYFPDLDASRFLAFAAVFLFHVVKSNEAGFDDNGFYTLIRRHLDVGHLGVDFFFTLSSFLISYLLLFELKQEKKIQTGNYLMRRVLRIWPLYFFILLMGFMVVPKAYVLMFPGDTLILPELAPFVLFYSNFYMMEHGASFIFILSILWTISIEEQFYLLWPFVCKLGFKTFPWLAALFILISIGASYFLNESQAYYHSLSYGANFGFGALAAYLVITGHDIIKSIKSLTRSKILGFYLSFLALIVSFPYWNDLGYLGKFEKLVFAGLFAFIILEQSFSSNSFFKLRNFQWISRAGKLSYGLYVYQALAIILVSSMLKMLISESSLTIYLIKPLLSFALCYLFAFLSYRYLEKPFLKLKSRYRVV